MTAAKSPVRARHSQPVLATAPPPKRSAQERLLAAATTLAGRDGYAQLTVERLIVAAGLSRATFYMYFTDVTDCFWGAYLQSAEWLLADVTAAVAGSAEPQLAAIGAIADFAVRRPAEARVLMRESLAASRRGLLERDALIARVEQAIAAAGGRAPFVELPVGVLIGGVFRFLVMESTSGSLAPGLGRELALWAGKFNSRRGERWGERLAPAPHQQHAPPPLSAVRIGGSSRERILRASAAVVRERGYAECTVDGIVAAAHTSRRTFYNEFPSKAAAIVAAYERGFGETLAACAPAFFSSSHWPEQVWQAGLAFTRYFVREPATAYVGFVECYAVREDFPARVHETQLAFTLFLEEGYRQPGGAAQLPRSWSVMTAATISELGCLASRGSPALYIRRMQPLAVYISLTPFIGCDQAGEFVQAKLARPGSR
jgi:AcrR family transcriptional regulator